MGYDRKQAIALRAADAKALLQSTLPIVLSKMTAAQIAQVQQRLDAEVVNPEIQKQADDVYRQSVTARSGNLVLRDERMVNRAYKIASTAIPATESDKHVRLDYLMLLALDALRPTTDNPDEAAYLFKVRNTLVSKGVWLRFDHKLVKDPQDPSRWMIDARSFEAWLSLGYDGDTIPTKNGMLTREALLGTTMLGAGYWEEVDRGPYQQALEKDIRHLEQQIDDGWEQHSMIASIRRQAFPGVVAVSDTLGGADFPDQSMWDPPRKMVLKALEMNIGGNVTTARPYLVVAAIMTRNAANLLANYIDDSGSGAERAVKVLKVAKTAGKVAEAGLAVTGVVALARGAIVVGGEVAADASVDAAANKLVKQAIAKDPGLAADLDQVQWVPGPKGTVLGRGFKAGQSTGNGTGFHRWP